MAVLYGVMFFNKVLFLNLAKKWPNISAIWSRMESSLGHYGYPRGLDTRINFMTCFWFGSLMVEYACWIVFSFLQVPDTYPNTPLGLIRGFSETTYGFVYHFIEYSDCAGVIIFVVDLLGTLNMVVPDVFLILCCMSLTERFKQINRSLETVRGKIVPAYFWRKIHEDYIVVTETVVTFNCAVSKIVLISIGNNMYFACYQLYGGLQSNGDLIGKIFFHLSFLFMAGKLFTSLSYLSQVHNEASQPRFVLSSVPQLSYCPEVQRFLLQTILNPVAITGHNYFIVTKGLILTIAGTILTYEIILIQLSPVKE